MDPRHIPKHTHTAASAMEVFLAFLKLGLTSFGGPIAHIGYFRRELVERRGWVNEHEFVQLLAICQFLPGPASSQLGFALGLLRAGWFGALAAFAGFTAPSALLLMLFATALPALSGETGDAALHGLKIVALAVVAQGLLGMSRQLCPDATRLTIATLGAIAVLVADNAVAQLLVVVMGAIAGGLLCHDVRLERTGGLTLRYGWRTGGMLIAVCTALLVLLPVLASGPASLFSVADAFYRSGALVFGGGHVVLPLLEEAVVSPGWLSADQFLAGYGAAQAVPGPVFAIAAYLGLLLPADLGGGLAGALVALTMLFLPGLLLIAGILPFWHRLAQSAIAARTIAGANAAVVGLLGAALYDPLFTSAVHQPLDLAIALFALLLLTAWRAPVLPVVVVCVVASLVAGAG